MTRETKVTFLTEPRVGAGVNIRIGRSVYVTTVRHVWTSYKCPGEFRVLDASGSTYVGSIEPIPPPKPEKTPPMGIQVQTQTSQPAAAYLWLSGPCPNGYPLPYNDAQQLNWGAFCLPLFWSIAHRVWIGVLVLIPVLNLVIPFVLLIKGNELAWRNRLFQNFQEFREVQDKWTLAGLIVFAAWVLIVGAVCWDAVGP